MTHKSIKENFESPIHQEYYTRLSKHRVRKFSTIEWDALWAFKLVDDVEQLLNTGAWRIILTINELA